MYQITLEVTLKKYKPNEAIEFRPVYFNSTKKKQLQIINLVSKMLFEKFCTRLMTGCMKDLAGLLN